MVRRGRSVKRSGNDGRQGTLKSSGAPVGSPLIVDCPHLLERQTGHPLAVGSEADQAGPSIRGICNPLHIAVRLDDVHELAHCLVCHARALGHDSQPGAASIEALEDIAWIPVLDQLPHLLPDRRPPSVSELASGPSSTPAWCACRRASITAPAPESSPCA